MIERLNLAVGKTEKQVSLSAWVTQAGETKRHKREGIHFAHTDSVPVFDVSMQRAEAHNTRNSHKTRFMKTYRGLLLKRKNREGGVREKNTARRQGHGRPLLFYAATRSAQSVHKHTPNGALVSQTGFTHKRKRLLGKHAQSLGCTGAEKKALEKRTATPHQDQNASQSYSRKTTQDPHAGNGEKSGSRNALREREKGRSLCS